MTGGKLLEMNSSLSAERRFFLLSVMFPLPARIFLFGGFTGERYVSNNSPIGIRRAKSRIRNWSTALSSRFLLFASAIESRGRELHEIISRLVVIGFGLTGVERNMPAFMADHYIRFMPVEHVGM